MHYTKQKAFTLVELIVVVTILAILATIGFVSYSSYLTWVRDTNRLAQLVSIHDWLELFRTKKDLPLPDESVDVIIDSETIAFQWFAGSNVLETIDFTKWGQDPRDWVFFSYYLTDDRKFFQLMAFLEEEANITAQNNSNSSPLSLGEGLGVRDTQAVDYTNRIPTIYWKKLWILTDTANTPIQDIAEIVTAGSLDLSAWEDTSSYVAHLTDTSALQWTATDSPLQYLERVWLGWWVASSCKTLIDRNWWLRDKDGVYVIDPEVGNPMPVYCDMTTDWGWWTLYSAKWIYWYPSTWTSMPTNDSLNNNISYNDIRWNFVSPSWLKGAYIYNIFNIEEWRTFLWGYHISNDIWWLNSDIHYSDSISFASALSVSDSDETNYSTAQFRKDVITQNINFLSWWVSSTSGDAANALWTAGFWSFSAVRANYIWFPATTYAGEWKIWEDRFTWSNTFIGDQSISIWIK